MNKTIYIGHDGTIKFLGCDPIGLQGTTTTKRFSHIRPVSLLLCILFRIIRRWFGDKGKAAAWTRLWPCEWEATIITTGEKFRSYARPLCLQWEEEQWAKPKCDL